MIRNQPESLQSTLIWTVVGVKVKRHFQLLPLGQLLLVMLRSNINEDENPLCAWNGNRA